MESAVLSAVRSRGFKGVTAAEIALDLGRMDDVNAVRDALDALVTDAKGKYALREDEDNSAGYQVVYELPADTRTRLYTKRTWLMIEDKVIPTMLRLLKWFVGFFLVFSIAICAFVLLLIAIRAGAAGHGSGQRNGLHGGYNTWLMYSLWRRNPFFRSYSQWEPIPREEPTAPLQNITRAPPSEEASPSLADEIFDFLFGPPRSGGTTTGSDADDPALLRALIEQNGGVVTADQVRPFVYDAIDSETSFMGRVCKRFGGEAFSPDGVMIKYKFPQLLREGSEPPVYSSKRYLQEPRWVFTQHSSTLAIGLGICNVLGLLLMYPYLYTYRTGMPWRPSTTASLRGASQQFHPQSQGALLGPLLGLVSWLFTPMCAYATLYFLIPACRYLLCVKYLNKLIEKRNDFRASLVARRLGSKRDSR